MVSVYGHEYHQAVDDGVDPAAMCAELGVRIAEVDGVAITLEDTAAFDEALTIAVALHAYSITIVETGEYEPNDAGHFAAAVSAFGRRCDLAAEHGIVVHIEPFAWSSLGRTADAVAIAEAADRSNGGVLLDLWHHVRGPDGGVLDPSIPMSRILGIQLADTIEQPWPNVRDECMTLRQLPGAGHAQLARRLKDLAARGPLPPIGVEVFGEVLDQVRPDVAASAARDALEQTMAAAGIGWLPAS